jgi:pimeloyl-ACP methyl ester carboxylesterase
MRSSAVPSGGHGHRLWGGPRFEHVPSGDPFGLVSQVGGVALEDGLEVRHRPLQDGHRPLTIRGRGVAQGGSGQILTVTDFLLIHGGSHGAWCWEAVIRELESLGARGHALDLPGAGGDPTPRATVTFDSCVSAANGFIREKALRAFVLVGHSLAGILLPDIVEANRGAVHGVVFVAAYVLDGHERAIDMVTPERVPEYYRLAEASTDRSIAVGFEIARSRFFSDLSDADARTAYEKLTPQPLAPYLHPARRDARIIGSISRYIACREDRNLPLASCLRFAEKLGVTTEEIHAGHDVMLSKPAELAALLVKRESLS